MINVYKAAVLAALMFGCCACGKWPQAVEKIETDTAVEIKVSREAVPAGSLVEADVKITPPANPPPPGVQPIRGILVPQGVNGPQG